MKNSEEKACLCALNSIFGFEPKTGAALIAGIGSAKGVFDLGSRDLDDLLGPYSKFKGLITPSAAEHAAKSLESLAAKNITFHGITEATYPQMLKECDDPPVGLYVRSSTPTEELWKGASVSVVGTRDISPYGREWCRRIVTGLSRTVQRPAIISGLALGTDIEAHKSALDSGLRTIAVMPTGPESIYPLRHTGFAEHLADTPGCALITDYPPGTAPLAVHFLRRNRIIAGLSPATILIESKIRGGGLMTCNLAFSYDRDVYALPGRIDDPRSQGCNELIRKKVAEPVTSLQGLIGSLGMDNKTDQSIPSPIKRLTSHYGAHVSSDELKFMGRILETVQRHRGIMIEDLAEATGSTYRKTAETASLLEIDGFITIDLLQRCCINPKNV